MVIDFSGTLSIEFVVIGRASTDNLGVLLGLRAKCCPCGHRWQKVAKKPKSEQNDIELFIFSLLDSSQCVDHFGVVERQKRIKMTKLWPPKDGPKVATWLILSQLVAILATFFKIRPPYLFCLLVL